MPTQSAQLPRAKSFPARGRQRAFEPNRAPSAGHAAAHDGVRLEEVLDADNTASDLWTDTAYRSAPKEALPEGRGLVPRLHRKKPKGRTLPPRARWANAAKSAVRSEVKHALGHQKVILPP